jgi:hypothetical protein
MCDWGGGPNELANYVYPEKTQAQPATKVKNIPTSGRGYAYSDENYKFVGVAKTSVIDNGTMLWMCYRDGTVTAHQGLHEEEFHNGE